MFFDFEIELSFQKLEKKGASRVVDFQTICTKKAPESHFLVPAFNSFQKLSIMPAGSRYGQVTILQLSKANCYNPNLGSRWATSMIHCGINCSESSNFPSFVTFPPSATILIHLFRLRSFSSDPSSNSKGRWRWGSLRNHVRVLKRLKKVRGCEEIACSACHGTHVGLSIWLGPWVHLPIKSQSMTL